MYQDPFNLCAGFGCKPLFVYTVRSNPGPGASPLAKKPKTDEEIAAFRDRVCDVATRLFIERGPQNVTMRQIASTLGVLSLIHI